MPKHLEEIRRSNGPLARKIAENGNYIGSEDTEALIAVNPNIQVLVKCNMMRVVISICMLNHLLELIADHTKLKAAALGVEELAVTGKHGTDYVRDVSLLA